MWYGALILLTAISLMGCLDQAASIASSDPQGFNPSPKLKHLAPFRVQITAPSGIPLRETENVLLEASVEILNNFTDDIVYTWKLPEDVAAVEGDLTGSFKEIQGGHKKLTLTVSGFSKVRNKEIFLEVKSKLGHKFVGSNGMIISQPEGTLEHRAMDLRKSAEEQFRNQAKDTEAGN
jgi:hypothetical protein